MNQQIMQLLRSVAARQRVASLGRWFYLFVLWLAGAYALALVVVRLLGVLPGWFTLPTLLIPAGLALVLAGILHRKPSQTDSARAIDESTGAKDVFLTVATIEGAPGEYKPLVLLEAQKRAADVRPAAVVPFNFWGRAGNVSACLLALLLAVLFFNPGWDPFGVNKAQQKEADRAKKLDKSIEEVTQRAQTLQNKALDAERSKDVDMALEELKKTFNQMKPQDPAGNLKKLQEQENQVGQMWQKSAEERLKDSLDKSSSQRFGSAETAKSHQWSEELKQGKTDSLQKEAQEIQKVAEQMKNETDPVARSQQQQEMEKRLQEMSDFVHNQAGRESLKDAIARAQQQLAAANNPAMASKAADAMAKSMSLTQSELKSLAQSMRDFQSLQKSLQAIQMAKTANDGMKDSQGKASKGLDGQKMSEMKSLDDYVKYFREAQNLSGGTPMRMSGGMGAGPGNMAGNNPGNMPGNLPGMGGQNGQGGAQPGAGPNNGGLGSGYRAANPNAKMAFKDEKDNSVLTAGKMLMEWKEKGQNEKGDAKKQYVQAITDLKQGVSEAILKEEIPPGYHDQIQKYFNDVEKVAKPVGPGGAAAEEPPSSIADPVPSGPTTAPAGQ